MSILLIDEQFLPCAQAVVENAKESIYISTFKAEITTRSRGEKLAKFFYELKEKMKQNVKVLFLINWNDERRSVAKTNLYACTELKKFGVKVRRLRDNRCCHAKIIIADKKTAIIGSHNLSVRSCSNNFEVSQLFQDPGTVQALAQTFEYSFNNAKDF